MAGHPYAGRVLATLLRPRFWAGHLAMLAAVAIAIGLGVWQLDAWHAGRAAATRDLLHKPAEPLSRVMTGDSAFPASKVGQPVQFSGTWLGAGTVYVSDQPHGRATGYWVVTPVLVGSPGTGSAMPVVRGWAPTPSAPVPSGPVAVTGWLQATDGSDAVDPNPDDDVIPALRIASLVQHVDADLYSGYVVARVVAPGDAVAGLAKVSPPAAPGVSTFTAVRNLFYAVEWWVFGCFAIFIWTRWCRDSLAPAQDTGIPGAPMRSIAHDRPHG